ncbi:hypothetical protein Kpol_2001p44, partial [Vanderwaltozyma polyspora DSM 70294]
MTEVRDRYANSILTSKSPFEATETIRIRLSEAKLINSEFYRLFKEVSKARAAYAAQLHKIASEHKNLEEILKEQLVTNQALTAEEVLDYNFDSLGQLKDVWGLAINSIERDSKSSIEFNDIVKSEVLLPLKQYAEKDPTWNRSRRLHARLSDIATKIDVDSQSKVPASELDEITNEWDADSR